MWKRRTSVLVLGYGAALAAIVWAAEPDSASRGRAIYEKRCTGCHELDRAKVGPPLRNVFARRAGADPRFPYSEALKKAQLDWNDATLDRWLADPDSLIPDNDMSFRLENAAERSAIIAYLKQMQVKQGEHR
jgi:cytochrome c